MSHINTLKVYDELVASGVSEKEAKAQVNALLELEDRLDNKLITYDNKLITYLKELKEDFASQKMITVLGSIIIIGMTAITSELWYLSKEVSILSRDMQEVRTYIFNK